MTTTDEEQHIRAARTDVRHIVPQVTKYVVAVTGDGLREALAPYNNEHMVEPYQRECYCRRRWKKEGFATPIFVDSPRTDCPWCLGEGQIMSELNPIGRWNYWSVATDMLEATKIDRLAMPEDEIVAVGVDGAWQRARDVDHIEEQGVWERYDGAELPVAMLEGRAFYGLLISGVWYEPETDGAWFPSIDRWQAQLRFTGSGSWFETVASLLRELRPGTPVTLVGVHV